MKTQVITGRIELNSGFVTPWIQFIDARLPQAEAEAEAIRLTSAVWIGRACLKHINPIVRCWIAASDVEGERK